MVVLLFHWPAWKYDEYRQSRRNSKMFGQCCEFWLYIAGLNLNRPLHTAWELRACRGKVVFYQGIYKFRFLDSTVYGAKCCMASCHNNLCIANFVDNFIMFDIFICKLPQPHHIYIDLFISFFFWRNLLLLLYGTFTSEPYKNIYMCVHFSTTYFHLISYYGVNWYYIICNM